MSVHNADSYLTTPTSDGSGESVHPSVFDFGAAWNGYRYWMAMTPFPGGDASYEYIEILASNDMDTWIDPGSNPVAGTAGGSNADPDLVKAPDDTLWCFWVKDGATCNMNVISSTDGVNWGASTQLFTGAGSSTISPAVIYDGSRYVMWYVDASDLNDKKVYRRLSNSPDSGWGAASECTISNIPSGKDIWHLDVNYDDVTGQYHMLATIGDAGTHGAHSELYFGWSSDGINWTFAIVPMLVKGPTGAWDAGRIYRSCWIRNGGNYELFYSADDTGEVGIGDSVWHIARITVSGI